MHRFRSMAAMLLWVLPTLASPSPDGGKPVRTAVIAITRCEAAASAISARAFRALLQPKLGAALQTEAETARPLGGLSERTLDEISRAVAAARREFYDHKVDAAVTQLKALAVDVTRIAPSQERWKVERELLTLLAQAQLPSDPSAAEAVLASVLRVDPSYHLVTGLYPPTFRKLVESIRAQQAELPTNRLDVAVFPSGTPVYVGGCLVGNAPLSHHFPSGEYRVEADFGHRSLVRTVQVPNPPGLVAPVELALGVEGSIVADAGPCLEPGADRAASLARFAKLVGAGLLLTIHTETPSNHRWVVVEEVDSNGNVVRQARSEVQPGSPETDALAALTDWAATDRAGPAVEVLKRPAAVTTAATPPATGQGQVSGRVVGQPPVKGFQLQAFPFNGKLGPTAIVHITGDRFTRQDLPKGRTAVHVLTDDGRVGTSVVEVPASGNVDTSVRVEQACNALGRVLDADGQPAAGAHLVAQQLGTRIAQSSNTGPKGGFIFTGLEKGEYEVRVEFRDRHLVRRFSLADSCTAMLGNLSLVQPEPSAPRSSLPAHDH